MKQALVCQLMCNIGACQDWNHISLQDVGSHAQVPTLEICAPGSGAAAARSVRKPGQSGSTMCEMGCGMAHSGWEYQEPGMFDQLIFDQQDFCTSIITFCGRLCVEINTSRSEIQFSHRRSRGTQTCAVVHWHQAF